MYGNAIISRLREKTEFITLYLGRCRGQKFPEYPSICMKDQIKRSGSCIFWNDRVTVSNKSLSLRIYD